MGQRRCHKQPSRPLPCTRVIASGKRVTNPCSRRIGLEINDQARNTNSESNQRIFQRYNRSLKIKDADDKTHGGRCQADTVDAWGYGKELI